MLLKKPRWILPGIVLVFLVVGCSPVPGVPLSEAATPSMPSPIPTTPAVQNTPAVVVTENPIIFQSPASQNGGVVSLAFSPDGRTLASLYKNGEITLWDAETRQNIRSFMGGSETGELGMMTGIAFTPDGKTLVSKVNGLTITLWDVAAGESIDVVRNLAHGNGMALSPNGTMLAYGQCGELVSGSRCARYEIMLWDMAARQPAVQPLRFGVAAPAPLLLLFSPDSQTLAVMSSGTTGSGKIELFDVVTRQPIGAPIGGDVQFTSMAFSPDGKLLALAGIPGVTYIWDVNSRQVVSQLIGEKGLMTGLIFSPNGKTLASRIFIPGADPKEKIVLWDMETRQAISQPLTGQAATGSEAGLISMAFSPDGRNLVSGTDTGDIILQDLTAISHSP